MPGKATPMSPWLLQRLLEKTGGFRAAHFAICTNCGKWTLEGIDNHVAGIQTTVDPTPLTPQQETECALNGRRTYTLGTTPGGKPQIEMRDPYATGRPIPRQVVPQHKCGHRYPDTRRPTPTNTDTCPY